MERRRYSRSDDEENEGRRRKEDLGQFLWTSEDPSGLPLRRGSRSPSNSSRTPSSPYSQDGPARIPRGSAKPNKEHAYRASRSNSRERIPQRRGRSGSSPRNNSHRYEKGMRSHNVESVSRKLGEETIEEKMDRYVKAAEREESARSRSSSDNSVRRAVAEPVKYGEPRSPSIHKSTSSHRKYDRESPRRRSLPKRDKGSKERSVSSRERRTDLRRGSEDRRPHRYRRSRSKSRSRSPIRYGRRDRPRRRRSRSRGRIRNRSPRRRRSRSRSFRRRSRSRDYRRRSRSRSFDRHAPRSRPRRSISRDRNRRPRHRSHSSSHSKSRSRASSIDRPKTKAEPTTDVKVGSLPLSTTASAMTPQMALQQTMAAMSAKAQALTGVELPKYYNPAAVNPLKYAEQVQKRKLLWQAAEKPEQEQPKNSVWDKLTFAQDQDGKMTAKFRKLMGIKNETMQPSATDSDTRSEGSDKQVDVPALQKQEELFRHLDQQYEVARMSTHTHRGVGLGYSAQVVFPPMQRPT